MNKKGFTLIELLSIIVILSVIAGITIPIVLNIINNSRIGTAKVSAIGFKDAIMKYYMNGIADGTISDMTGNYDILNGVLKNDIEQHDIKVTGIKPKSGNVDITEGDLVKGCVQIDKFAVLFSNSDISKIEKGSCSDVVVVTASQLEYTTEHNSNITNVQEALDDLYEKVGN